MKKYVYRHHVYGYSIRRRKQRETGLLPLTKRGAVDRVAQHHTFCAVFPQRPRGWDGGTAAPKVPEGFAMNSWVSWPGFPNVKVNKNELFENLLGYMISVWIFVFFWFTRWISLAFIIIIIIVTTFAKEVTFLVSLVI